MNFDTFLDQAWTDHATDAAAVAARLPDAIALVGEATQLTSLAHLAQHVHGSHLGRWDEGIAFQERLSALPAGGDAERAAIGRYIAALRVAAGTPVPEGMSASDRIRIGALAASALVEHDTARAGTLFEAALDQAEGSGLDATDPMNRTLAVTGNTLAATLEERATRSDAERALMLTAARAGRTYWERAGSWLEVERAEYRLAMSHLAAGDAAAAERHARECLAIVRANGEVPLERFFGWEALARAQRAAGHPAGEAVGEARRAFNELSADDQSWCRSSLDRLLA